MNGVDWLSKNLKESLALPEDAVSWLLMLYGVIQVFDDVADGDEVSRDDLNSTIWNTLVGVYHNKFFIQNSAQLIPIISIAILKWQASDTAERSGSVDAMSFVWRAGYYDVVLAVVHIIHGREAATVNAHRVMQLYGEKLEDYLEEFSHA